ncbi:hypothetical protein SteCoe_31671 [Stentor coeruleus]|uniref:G-protein coupled receptors family 2 profile 2 domain-containing protein n=1 Tax=Stentor coeruleus TaxID=5963 RepID=A0A1R2B0Q8_9CILI|nr:hypothetical protein SteCoe_31671 [Stentor coeruleus]
MCSYDTIENVSFYVEATSALLGVGGALCIIVSYLSYKNLRTFYFRILFYISITDGLKGAIFFIPANLLKITEICIISAVTTNYMTMASSIWTLLISVIIYQATANSSVKVEKYIRNWSIFVFCIMPFFYLLPLSTNSFGLIDINCTFKENIDGNLWRLGLFYIPGWIMIFISFYAYNKVFKSSNLELVDESTKTLLKKVTLYPLVIIILFTLLSILRILMITIPESCALEYFSTAVMGIYAAHGFWNAMIFFTTPSVQILICKRKMSFSSGKSSVTYSSQASSGSNINLLDCPSLLIKESISLKDYHKY